MSRIDECAKWATDVRGDLAELNIGLTRDEAFDIAECFAALVEVYRAAQGAKEAIGWFYCASKEPIHKDVHAVCTALVAAIEKVEEL